MLRVFNHWFSARKFGFFVVESTAIGVGGLTGAAAGAMASAPAGHPFAIPANVTLLASLAVAFVAVLQFSLYALDLYDLRIAGEDRPRGSRLLRGAGVAVAVIALASFALPGVLPAGALLGGALGAVTGALVARGVMASLFAAPIRLLIVGNGQKARAVANAIADQGDELFELCAQVDPLMLSGEGSPKLEDVALAHRAEIVVMAPDEQRGLALAESLVRCRIRGMRVYDAAGFCERVLRRIPVAFLRATELAYADELTVSAGRRFFKRLFDVTVAAILLVLAAPLMLLIAVAIKLDSKGPVFYRQERTGLDGRSYRLWKFRSMRTDAEKDGAVWAKQNDDRVTRVGRFIRRTRMDEIPQVFNVLNGDMSFVGPRPERPVFVQQLKAQIPYYGLREGVKPGITGWAQIRYPYGASVEDAQNKLEFDLYYVKNGSLFLDMAIIFHTVRHVLLGRGAR
ncbi:MAG: sugar transferase [Myxococcaceae bacterium]|nr:sugar transferase [Myxococcaceae bacterium]